VREKYGWKFTIVYDKPQPNEQAVYEIKSSIYSTNLPRNFLSLAKQFIADLRQFNKVKN
jgi:hypothetical protein